MAGILLSIDNFLIHGGQWEENSKWESAREVPCLLRVNVDQRHRGLATLRRGMKSKLK